MPEEEVQAQDVALLSDVARSLQRRPAVDPPAPQSFPQSRLRRGGKQHDASEENDNAKGVGGRMETRCQALRPR